MDCSTDLPDYGRLAHYRDGLYQCFVNARDALMNTGDALLTETRARSFAQLSLSPFFARRWPSLYEAFDDAKIDQKALQTLFVSAIPESRPGKRLVLAADASPIVRAESPTAQDRTYVHVPNLPQEAKPVLPGWQFATVVALPEQPSSWTTILSNQRINSEQSAAQVVAAQLTELSPLLAQDALVVCDAGFGNPSFLSLVHALPVGKLLRLAKNRTLYRPAPPPTGKRGAPKKDGEPFALHDACTHGTPDEQWSGIDAPGHVAEVACWHHLHFKECRAAEVTLVRVRRPGVTDGKREPRVLWLIWQGASMPPLRQMPSLYRRRYSVEHSYRFDKQELLWTQPRLRTPEKFEAWTQVVSAVHNQITLARAVAQAVRQPWESRKREPTPSQVRRACGRIVAQLGTPAALPQVRGKSPGRRQGAQIKKAERFATIFKQPNKKKAVV